MTRRRGSTSPAEAASWAALAGISGHKATLIELVTEYLDLRYPHLDRMSIDTTDGPAKIALKIREVLDNIRQLEKGRAE